MSRSRKAPFYADRNPFAKNQANRKMRQKNKKACVKSVDEVKSGKSYKKNYESWDICDYRFESKEPKARRK